MYQRILVPVDLNDASSWAKSLPTAVRLCETFGASLHLLCVVPDFGMPIVSQYFPPDHQAKLRAEFEARLADLQAKEVPTSVNCGHTVLEGKVYDQILAAADGQNIDLIVMGSHHPELSDYLLGPNAARVVRHADCSVMVVRD